MFGQDYTDAWRVSPCCPFPAQAKSDRINEFSTEYIATPFANRLVPACNIYGRLQLNIVPNTRDVNV